MYQVSTEFMPDPGEVLCSILSDYWNRVHPQLPWRPLGFETRWPVPGETMPFISVTLYPSPVDTKGLPGKKHYTRKRYMISFWCLDRTRKHFAERKIIQCLVENNKNPKTKVFSDTGISFIQIEDIDDSDDTTTSPVLFRRDITVIIHYQDDYS